MNHISPYEELEIRVRHTFERQPPQVIIPWDGKSRSKEAALTLAPLIAKAPEMLSHLKDMVTGYGHLMGCERVYCSPLCRQTRALLRRLRGACDKCGGLGTQPDLPRAKCSRCAGTGQIPWGGK